MSLEIVNKRSSALNSAPSPSQLEAGEIGINYNAASLALYVKDTDGNIRKIAGPGSTGLYWDLTGSTLSPDSNTYGVDIGASNIVLNVDGTAAFAGKVTSATTASSDSGSTLTTKDYVDSVVPSDIGVSKIIAGSNIDIVPVDGTGDVTITATGGGQSSDIQWDISTNESIEYIFAGPGFDPSAANPTLYVVRGQTYIFNKTVSGHPFQLQLAPGDGQSPYTLGVTGDQPIADADSITWVVPMDAPAVLHYACTAHPSAMTGTIYVLNEGGGGGTGVTKLTAGAGISLDPVEGTGEVEITATGGGGGGAVNSVTGGTNINVGGTTADPVVNLDDSIALSGSITADGDITGRLNISAAAAGSGTYCELKSNGNATFTGTIDLGAFDSSDDTASGTKIYSDGIIYQQVPRDYSTASEAYQVWHGDDKNVHFTTGGAATFEGQVEAKGGIKFGDGTTQTTAATGGGGGGVTKIIAGSNIDIVPTSGQGEVTITATGGSGGSSVAVSDTAPSNPSVGDQWWDSSEEGAGNGGRMYLYYDGAWVQTSNVGFIDGGSTTSPGTAKAWLYFDGATDQVLSQFNINSVIINSTYIDVVFEQPLGNANYVVAAGPMLNSPGYSPYLIQEYTGVARSNTVYRFFGTQLDFATLGQRFSLTFYSA